MSKKNPANLNPLQLKTLTLFQALAKMDGAKTGESEGSIRIDRLPHAHGDHFHMGPYVVLGKDATGLHNEAVWVALERKGFIKSLFPIAVEVTKTGLEYETGLANELLHSSGH
jgi:hypothetical protein